MISFKHIMVTSLLLTGITVDVNAGPKRRLSGSALQKHEEKQLRESQKNQEPSNPEKENNYIQEYHQENYYLNEKNNGPFNLEEQNKGPFYLKEQINETVYYIRNKKNCGRSIKITTATLGAMLIAWVTFNTFQK